MSFAENIKSIRLNAGMTQQALAEKLNLDRSAIAHYENGDSTPTVKTLCKISELFEISIENLLK